jgi:hypothetical protein
MSANAYRFLFNENIYQVFWSVIIVADNYLTFTYSFILNLYKDAFRIYMHIASNDRMIKTIMTVQIIIYNFHDQKISKNYSRIRFYIKIKINNPNAVLIKDSSRLIMQFIYCGIYNYFVIIHTNFSSV